MMKPLIVMALPQESRGELERAGAEVLYTGVGKVNAAASLARIKAAVQERYTQPENPSMPAVLTAKNADVATADGEDADGKKE